MQSSKKYIDENVNKKNFYINTYALNHFGSARSARSTQENPEFADFENHLNTYIEDRNKNHQKEAVDSFIKNLRTQGLPALDILIRDAQGSTYASKPFYIELNRVLLLRHLSLSPTE
jgi:hypothetical protein